MRENSVIRTLMFLGYIMILVVALVGCPDDVTRKDPIVTTTTLTAMEGLIDGDIVLSWTNLPNNFAHIEISWTLTDGSPTTDGPNQPVTVRGDEVDRGTIAITDLKPGIRYTFSLTFVDNRGDRTEGPMASAVPSAQDLDGDGVHDAVDRDDDGDGLIEIDTLDMLNDIRNKLDGTAYNDGSSDDNTGCGGMTGVTTCSGYELTRDLDFADGASYASGSINSAWRPNNADPSLSTNPGWVPIGSDFNTPFTATFEGNGYSIKSLYVRVEANGDAYAGLFSAIDSGAVVRNIGVVGVSVSAISGSDTDDSAFSGGFAGVNAGSMINAWSTGSISAVGTDVAMSGGLVGWNYIGSMINAWSTGSISATAANDDAMSGGLVGWNYIGSITNAWAAASVAAVNGGAGNTAGANSGGLAGWNTGSITNAWATALLSTAGNQALSGGLVGFSAGSIVNAWVRSSASAYSSRALRYGRSDGLSRSGGLAGAIFSHRITNTYWDSESTLLMEHFRTSSATVSGDKGGDGTISGVGALTSAQMQAITGIYPVFSIRAIPAFYLGASSDYPILRYGGTTGTDCKRVGTTGSLPVCEDFVPGQAVRMASGFLRFTNTMIGKPDGSDPLLFHAVGDGETIEISGAGVNGTTAGGWSIENESGAALSSPTVSGTTITMGGFTGEFYLKATFTKGSESFTRRYRFKK